MVHRLALGLLAAMPAAMLASCGEAVGDPQPVDSSERETLADAAEMLPPAPEESPLSDRSSAPSRAGDAPDAVEARAQP